MMSSSQASLAILWTTAAAIQPLNPFLRQRRHQLRVNAQAQGHDGIIYYPWHWSEPKEALSTDALCQEWLNTYVDAHHQICSVRYNLPVWNDNAAEAISSDHTTECIEGEYVLDMCHFRHKCTVHSDYKACSKRFIERGLGTWYYVRCTGWTRYPWIEGEFPSSKGLCVRQREFRSRQGLITTEADEEPQVRAWLDEQHYWDQFEGLFGIDREEVILEQFLESTYGN